MEDEGLVLGENLFEIRAVRVDPEFCHAARAMKAAGDEATPLAFANIAQIDDHDIRVLEHRYSVGGFDLCDRGPRARDQCGGVDFERVQGVLPSWIRALI